MSIHFIMADSGQISATIDRDGQVNTFVVGADHPNYKYLRDAAIDNNELVFLALIEIEATITDREQGDIALKDGKVLYKGKHVHNSITKRMLIMMRHGFSPEPLLETMCNVFADPEVLKQLQTGQKSADADAARRLAEALKPLTAFEMRFITRFKRHVRT